MPGEKERERRPTPDEILARVMRQEKQEKRGRLKIFLGFAAGVGKTFEMLNEANRRKQRGQEFVRGSIINRLTQELRTIDILLVAASGDTNRGWLRL